MEIGQGCINLIKEFEGCELTAYHDVKGVLTIGYGTAQTSGLITITEGMTISEDQAEDLLKQELAGLVGTLNNLITVPVTQNQFDALADFSYNCGIGNFEQSTLLKLLNSGNYDGAANEFPKWDRAGKVVVPGLERRRIAEQTLFNTPDDNS